MKRSGRFYRKNESEIMRLLGLKPTKNSGSGWIEKEDGQSENVICQLKSTDAMSIKVNLEDIRTLEYNAVITHKIPVFAIQFLKTQEVFLLFKPEDLQHLSEYIKTGNAKSIDLGIDIKELEDEYSESNNINKKIKSSSSARDKYFKEYEKKFKKERKSAR